MIDLLPVRRQLRPGTASIPSRAVVGPASGRRPFLLGLVEETASSAAAYEPQPRLDYCSSNRRRVKLRVEEAGWLLPRTICQVQRTGQFVTALCIPEVVIS